MTGYYFDGGTHEGKPYYVRQDEAYYIFWFPEGPAWWIRSELAVGEPPAWTLYNANPPGNYDPTAPATGVATVTACEW